MKYKLNELGDFKNGANYPKGSYGKGLKIVNVKDLFPSHFVDYSNLKELKENVLKNPEQYELKHGDILFTRSSLVQSGTGMCAMIENPEEKVIYCGFIIRFRPNLDMVDPYYMTYLLRSDRYRNKFIQLAAQTTITNINQKTLGEIEIDIPDIFTQNKTAHTLYLIDNKTRINSHINRNLLDQGRALYEDLISKYEINAKLSDLISSIETGSRPKGGAQESGVPSIGAEKIESFGVYDYSGEKYISEEFFEKLKRGHILSGDVLLYKDGAYTGKTSMALNDFPHAKCAINEHVYKLNSNNNLYQFFLYFTLDNKKNRDYIYTLASSKAAQPGLNQTELLSVDIAMPVETSLIEFEKNVSEMMNMIASNAKENRKLTLLRDSLLPKLMSGEIDVSELDV